MADSGIAIVDFLFNLAVRWLYALANFLGITYEEINVWIFVVSWPASLVLAAFWNISPIPSVKFAQENNH